MYRVAFTATATDDLAILPKTIAQRMLTKIKWLAENFEVLTPEPLTARWEGVYKLRVGNYRVLYTFSRPETSVTVHFVRHRREVYKS